MLHFYKLKARPATSKKIKTHFIVVLALFWWPGTEPEVCLYFLVPYIPKIESSGSEATTGLKFLLKAQ